MNNFERISLVVGVVTAVVATATFLFSTGRGYLLSVQSERRDWAKSSIIRIFEDKETLSFQELYSEFTATGADENRKGISRRALRRSLLGLMETDVVAYNEDNAYFLKREAFFRGEEEEKERQADVLRGATEALSLVAEPSSGDSLDATFVLEDHILHIVGFANGRFTKDELAGQLSRYFELSGFGFRDYARQITLMLDAGLLHQDAESKITNYPRSQLASFAAAIESSKSDVGRSDLRGSGEDTGDDAQE